MALIDGLISHWKLDEVSTGVGAVTRNDSHGTNHLADTNTTPSAAGKIDNAAQFTKVNSEILSISSNSSLQAGDIDFSLCCWVKLSSKPAAIMGIVNKGNNSGPAASNEYTIFYSNTQDRFGFEVSNGTTATPIYANNLGSPVINTWYFIACWYDSAIDRVRIQVNNGDINSTSHTGGAQTTSFVFQMGHAYGSSRYLDGFLDSVSFWKRVLTESERAVLYNNGNGLNYPFNLPTTFIDFAVGTVSGLHSANSGYIDLTTNHGLKFPNTAATNRPFYLTWWNSSDYSDSTDDPNVEIVQCYKRIGDKLLIRRGCFGTAASDKNLVGKTYKIAQFFDQSIINKRLIYFKNPSRGSYYFHDFELDTNRGSDGSVDSLYFDGVGTGAAMASIDSADRHVGIVRLTAGTSGSARLALFFGSTSWNSFSLGQYDLELTTWVSFPNAIGENSKSFTFASGFGSSMSNHPFLTSHTNCVVFYYSTNSPNWQFSIRDSNTAIISEVLPIKVQSNLWYELKIKTYKGNICDLFINKMFIKRYVGQLPTGLSKLMAAGVYIGQTSGQGDVDLDAIELKADFGPERSPLALNS